MNVMASAKGVRKGFLIRPVLSPLLKLSREIAKSRPSSVKDNVGVEHKSMLGRLLDLVRLVKLTS